MRLDTANILRLKSIVRQLGSFSGEVDEDRMGSSDFEDIVAVIAGRPTIVDESAVAPPEVRNYLAKAFRAMLANRDIESFIAGALSSSAVLGDATSAVIARCLVMTELPEI